MPKASARDLLRKAREQKKQQLQQSSGSSNASSRLTALARIEPSMCINDSGTLHCNKCRVQVKPADAVGWSVHSKSHRHRNILQQTSVTAAPFTTAKRGRNINVESSPTEVSDNLATQLNIARDMRNSVSEINESAQQTANAKRRKISGLVTYDNASDSDSSTNKSLSSNIETDDASSNDSADNAQADIVAAGALPSGFFDEGVRHAEFSDGEDNHEANGDRKSNLAEMDNVRRASISSNQHTAAEEGKIDNSAERALPKLYNSSWSSGNDQTADSSDVETAQKTVKHATNLKDSLAAFESEISSLAIHGSSQQQIGNDLSSLEGPSDYDHGQEDQWSQRTRHLAQLNSIIQEGMQEMNPDESADAAADGNTSESASSDADYAVFTDWRSYLV
ncbi:hypothetical protein H4R24_000386 [Coemansia sp. RSA 988]|nr:hypothetical protein H4R24_000386 [Coemansia sp. RSA 988]